MRFLKLAFLAVAGLSVAMTTSRCSDSENDNTVNTLSVSPSSVTFAYDQTDDAKEFTVETDAGSFLVSTKYDTDDTDWLQVDRKTGGFDVTVLSINEGSSSRVATLTVTAGNATAKTVTVTQLTEGDVVNTLEVDPDELEFAWDISGAASDQKVTVTTDAESFGHTVAYDDDITDWLDIAQESDGLLVATKGRNNGEEARTATITVTAGTAAERTIAVTQLAYVETDFTITLTPDELEFAATGSYLTKTVEIATNGTNVTASPVEGWITPSVAGNILTITVGENGSGYREGSVIVENEEGEQATLTVVQHGQPSLDIAGQWKWSSVSSLSNTDWTSAEDISLTVNIEAATSDTYAIIGVIGAGMKARGLDTEVPDAKMFLYADNGEIKVGDDLTFNTGGFDYYTAKSIFWTEASMETQIFQNGNFICERYTTEEEDGIYEVIAFPTTYIGTEAEFPEEAYLWDQEGVVSYNYWYVSSSHPVWGETKTIIDFHRNVVLKRLME